MAIPDLSPHALASLLAIAEHGSVSAAARARGLTQPSISRQVQELERQLGVHLVERTSQGARLTPAGEILADGARDILSSLSSLPERVKARQGEVSGRVRVGTTDSIGIYVLPKLLAQFVDDNPRIDVQLVCASSPQLMAMLLDDELDVAIGTTEHPKLSCERLFQNPLVLAYAPDLPEDRIPTTIKELAEERIVTFDKGLTIRNLLDQAFARAGFTFKPVMSLSNVEVIKAMVKAGLGYGIIPDGCVWGDELATRPVRDLNIARTIRLMYRPQNQAMASQRMVDWLRKLRQP
ncbi:MAG: LysR family transcriptional regulator [Planctomycetes bacterium]|jgi:molybdate transport repressor ModE-like protein|nr:LysR family transcriptional regulator [Planctomycetota bacterium]